MAMITLDIPISSLAGNTWVTDAADFRIRDEGTDLSNRRGNQSVQCRVCGHPDRHRIDLLLAGGASFEAVARKYRVSADSAARHARNHLPAERRAQLIAGPLKLAELADKAAEEGMALLDYVKIVRTVLMARLLAADEARDNRGTALLGGRVAEILRLEAQLAGDLQRAVGPVNQTLVLNSSPEVAALEAMLIERLAPYPDAAAAVLEGLRQLRDRAVRGARDQVEQLRPVVAGALEVAT